MDKPFIERLMDLITIEANNADYYVDGYVDAYKLDELINEFYPEYEFKSAYTYSHWHPRNPINNPLGLNINELYSKAIIEALERPLFMPDPKTINNSAYVTFPIKPTTDKKDEQS